MRTKIIIFFAVLAIVAGGAWTIHHLRSSWGEFDPKANVLPVDVTKVLDGSEKFVLLSLDPTYEAHLAKSEPTTNEIFHDYGVLGKTEIRTPQERAELLKALYQGMTNSDGSVAGCFNPRHGISATRAGQTVDLVICFQCLSMVIYAKDTNSVLTTSSPQPAFNRALEKAGLPIAK